MPVLTVDYDSVAFIVSYKTSFSPNAKQRLFELLPDLSWTGESSVGTSKKCVFKRAF